MTSVLNDYHHLIRDHEKQFDLLSFKKGPLRLLDKRLQHSLEKVSRNLAIRRAKMRHPRRTKLAAARSAAAYFMRRLSRVFARRFA